MLILEIKEGQSKKAGIIYKELCIVYTVFFTNTIVKETVHRIIGAIR